MIRKKVIIKIENGRIREREQRKEKQTIRKK